MFYKNRNYSTHFKKKSIFFLYLPLKRIFKILLYLSKTEISKIYLSGKNISQSIFFFSLE